MDPPRLASSFHLPNRLPPCLVLLLAAALPAVGAADCPPPRPSVPRVAVAPAAPDGKQAPIEVSSDGATLDPEGNTELSGNVHVTQGARDLKAEDATYDARAQSITARGTVRYEDPQLKLAGSQGSWLENGTGHFERADFELLQRSARGHAEDMQLESNGELLLKDVRFTSCPAGKDDWMIKAGSIEIDRDANQGIAHDMRLEFKGVPILYAPVLSFPVSDERKSGFLVPVPNHSGRNGWELSVPYYFNIAPDYDATLALGEMTARGPTVGGEFRFLTPSSNGVLAADWLPHDAQSDRDRSYLRLRERTDLSSRVRLDVNASAISDSHYFEDFGQGPEGTSVTYLPRQMTLTYLDDHWRAVGMLEQFQTIDQTVATIGRPYTRLPDLMVTGRWNLPGRLEGGVDAEAVYFTREDSVAGARASINPTLRYVWRTPGAFVIPSLGYQAIGYQLSNPTLPSLAAVPAEQAQYARSPSVQAPAASLDSGLIFERIGQQHVTTLEPRVLYSYVPYRNQDGLPVFDTALPDLNIVQLFRTQRYVGGDRIADGNQIAAGFTSRIIDSTSGQELVTGTVGETHYFERPKVTLPGEAPIATHSSDAVAEIMLHAYRNWNVGMGTQWSPQTSSAQKNEFTLQYRPSGEQVVNFSYRYRRDLLEQLDGNFAWPITPAWNVVGREVYSLLDRTSIDTLFGIQYRSCCWKVRIVGRRDIVRRPTDLTARTGERDTSIALELELNGLATVGSSATTFLKTAIRGYSPTVAGNPLADHSPPP